MANIKELKKRIRSTKSTLKITTAMKLVSAAKMSKAQHAVLSTRPYAHELDEMIKTISALAQDYTHNMLEDNKSNKDLLVVISSNKGLCGGYNSQLFKQVHRFIKEYNSENDQRELEIIFIGTKVKELLNRQKIEGALKEFEKAEPTLQDITNFADELQNRFQKNEIGKIFVGYNHFKSAISFDSKVKQILPISLDHSTKDKLKEEFPFDFKYDPNAPEIMDTIIPEAFVTNFYTCILDALASEHGSRMSAMDSASNNCKDAIRSLTLEMNKARQAAITTELIEVVSGAESLNG